MKKEALFMALIVGLVFIVGCINDTDNTNSPNNNSNECPDFLRTSILVYVNNSSTLYNGSNFYFSIVDKDNKDSDIICPYDCPIGNTEGQNINYIYCTDYYRCSSNYKLIDEEGVIKSNTFYDINIIADKRTCKQEQIDDYIMTICDVVSMECSNTLDRYN